MVTGVPGTADAASTSDVDGAGRISTQGDDSRRIGPHNRGMIHNQTTETPAVVTESLTKRFGSRTVVDSISFSVPAGMVAGLVGPNGAGKTTIMGMLLGLVRPTSGEAFVLGSPVSRRADYLPRVGSLIESPAFHPGVTGVDNLRALAIIAGHPTSGVDDLIDVVGLTGRGGDRYGTYSLGMKQRLGIAAALIGDPELVILDEPTNGLDPIGMQDVRRLIREIGNDGKTVIVSSHLLAELEMVCDWLVVVAGGLAGVHRSGRRARRASRRCTGRRSGSRMPRRARSARARPRSRPRGR